MKFVFSIAAILCIATGIYHVVGVFYPVNDAPPLRHLVFVGINAFFTYGFLYRPRYFVYVFGILLVQQLYSHRGHLYHSYGATHHLDYIDLGVVVLMPVLFGLLVWDANHLIPGPSPSGEG